jgi:hypothetical protein
LTLIWPSTHHILKGSGGFPRRVPDVEKSYPIERVSEQDSPSHRFGAPYRAAHRGRETAAPFLSQGAESRDIVRLEPDRLDLAVRLS